MGQHVWLLLATIGTELLAITKWSQGQFPEPLPKGVKWAWTIGALLLVLYPTVWVRGLFCASRRLLKRLTGWMTVQFGLPAARRYLRQHQRNAKAKNA